MNKLKGFNSKLQSFLMGRNGSDLLGRCCLWVALVFICINLFFPTLPFEVISLALLFYCMYRMFSSNIIARREENQKFTEWLAKIPFLKVLNKSASEFKHDPAPKNCSANSYKQAQSTKTAKTTSATKTTKPASSVANTSTNASSPDKLTFLCESCGQSLSVPKGRGKLKITCPKCAHQMKIDS